jgi:stearoyl-CoA desaturase (delta-9 desaturase)
MKLETKSPPTVSVGSEESLARAIVQLNPKSARAKRVVALVTIGVPAIGFAVAMYLVFTGRATALDDTLFGVFYAITRSVSASDSIAISRTRRSRHPGSSRAC